ncbi:S66 peptidase family protein [Neolewinella agarilytica]|uniref:S66 peptidase family protein n=1 Tax=Neolewinella agarilytica TaxID=478744 RepID=UPI00235230A6|nr:LD-carboxypeptidase [Neolewinella agarilytica]
MHRRQFLTASGVLLAATACKTPALTQTSKQAAIHPTPPEPGASIALICPGGPITPERLQKSVALVESFGFKVQPGKNILARNGYLAGTDEERLADLHAAFSNPDIQAVWAIRGGYGCTRLLPLIDYDLIRANPKLLIGYSDITALLNAFYQQTGLMGIHGPVASSTVEEIDRTRLAQVLGIKERDGSQTKVLTTPTLLSKGEGTVNGVLVGGNLTLLASMTGTPYTVNCTDKIVLLEDVGEKPYRIDRMLTQLRQGANLDKAKGILLGEFVDCEADIDDNSLGLVETLSDRLYDLGVPILAGFPAGHGDRNYPVPIGGRVEMNVGEGSLSWSSFF